MVGILDWLWNPDHLVRILYDQPSHMTANLGCFITQFLLFFINNYLLTHESSFQMNPNWYSDLHCTHKFIFKSPLCIQIDSWIVHTRPVFTLEKWVFSTCCPPRWCSQMAFGPEEIWASLTMRPSTLRDEAARTEAQARKEKSLGVLQELRMWQGILLFLLKLLVFIMSPWACQWETALPWIN